MGDQSHTFEPVTGPVMATDLAELDCHLRVHFSIDSLWVATGRFDALRLFEVYETLSVEGAAEAEVVALEVYGDPEAGLFFHGDVYYLMHKHGVGFVAVQRLIDLPEDDPLIERLRQWFFANGLLVDDELFLQLARAADERLAAGLTDDPGEAFQDAVMNLERLYELPWLKFLHELIAGLLSADDKTWLEIQAYVPRTFNDALGHLNDDPNRDSADILREAIVLYSYYRQAFNPKIKEG
jgi:hypothetical protein